MDLTSKNINIGGVSQKIPLHIRLVQSADLSKKESESTDTLDLDKSFNNNDLANAEIRLQKLYLRYRDVVSREPQIAGTSDPLELISNVRRTKSSDQLLLNKFISSLVKGLDVDDPQDERIEDVILLVADKFSVLKRQINNDLIKKKLTKKIKTFIGAYRQRKKSKRLKYDNVNEHLQQLYIEYPAVKQLSDETALCTKIPTYRETVHSIVQLIGITDPKDSRTEHAISLIMDQYPLLRSQICNVNLRKQFMSRVRQAVLRPEYMLTHPDRCDENEYPTHLELVNTGDASQPIIVELVMDGDSSRLTNEE